MGKSNCPKLFYFCCLFLVAMINGSFLSQIFIQTTTNEFVTKMTLFYQGQMQMTGDGRRLQGSRSSEKASAPLPQSGIATANGKPEPTSIS